MWSALDCPERERPDSAPRRMAVRPRGMRRAALAVVMFASVAFAEEVLVGEDLEALEVNATLAAEQAAAAAARAARPPELTEMEKARIAASMLPTAKTLSGRDLKGPPQYAGRRMWDDPLEVNLRAFFEGMGGLNWFRRDGWILTGEPPPPPPPPEFNKTLDLLDTTQALFRKCNATELAMPMPTDLESWEFVATVAETPSHPGIKIHLDRTAPEVYGDSVVVRFPETHWLLQDNYTKPWWNGEEQDVAQQAWWETLGNGTQMDDWGSRRSAFYLNMMRYILRNDSEVNITAFEHSWLSEDLATDFYVHDKFCDSQIENCTAIDTFGEEFAAVSTRARSHNLIFRAVSERLLAITGAVPVQLREADAARDGVRGELGPRRGGGSGEPWLLPGVSGGQHLRERRVPGRYLHGADGENYRLHRRLLEPGRAVLARLLRQRYHFAPGWCRVLRREGSRAYDRVRW